MYCSWILAAGKKKLFAAFVFWILWKQRLIAAKSAKRIARKKERKNTHVVLFRRLLLCSSVNLSVGPAKQSETYIKVVGCRMHVSSWNGNWWIWPSKSVAASSPMPRNYFGGKCAPFFFSFLSGSRPADLGADIKRKQGNEKFSIWSATWAFKRRARSVWSSQSR